MNIIIVASVFVTFVGNGMSQSEQDLYNMFTYQKLRIVCSRGVPFRYRILELECCKAYESLMQKYWRNGDRYLSEYLEFLRTWRCPQFKKECDRRLYAFNDFTSLVFDRFCNKTLMTQKCGREISDIVGVTAETDRKVENSSHIERQGNVSYQDELHWDKMIKRFNPALLKKNALNKPCVQVAQLDSSRGGFGSFQEVLSFSLPFCSMTWCGFSRDVVQRGVSLYHCLPTSCQINIIIIVTVTIILSLAIILSNVLATIVFVKILPTRNAQCIYKISMAVADLFTGILVMPSIAITLLSSTHQDVGLAPDYTLKLPEFSNQFVIWSKVPMAGRDGVTVRHPTRLSLKEGYVDAVGCITTISLLASIYTLAGASADRLWAVHLPLRYRAYDTKKFAIRLVIAIWLVTIFISLLPFMGIGLKYSVIASVIISFTGTNVNVLYICILLVPILIVWITNVVLYWSVRKQTNRRRQISSGVVDLKDKKESRLAVTLLIMVGVFTICVLPIAVVAIVNIVLADEMDPADFATFRLWRLLLLNSMDYIVSIILLSNSLWNVAIYSFRNKEFKKASKVLIRRVVHCVGMKSHERKTSGITSAHTSKAESHVQTAMTALPKSHVAGNDAFEIPNQINSIRHGPI